MFLPSALLMICCRALGGLAGLLLVDVGAVLPVRARRRTPVGESPPAVMMPSYGFGFTPAACDLLRLLEHVGRVGEQQHVGHRRRAASARTASSTRGCPRGTRVSTPSVFHFSMKLSSCDCAAVVSPPLLIDEQRGRCRSSTPELLQAGHDRVVHDARHVGVAEHRDRLAVERASASSSSSSRIVADALGNAARGHDEARAATCR